MKEEFLRNVLATHCPEATLQRYNPVGGGCINNAFQLYTDQGKFFLKENATVKKDFFAAEAKGLALLRENCSLQIPTVLGHSRMADSPYLLLKWIDSGHASGQFWEDFGAGLAKLHQSSADHFGLDHDNYIGSLPQTNSPHNSWADFFIAERLKPQLSMAASRSLVDKRILSDFQRLFNKLERLVPDERPALLHGDLWSGNFMSNEHSQPVLIDPATHFGHRETEVAFTHLFGGFDVKFYRSYQESAPLVPGFEERIELHNLYPLLVHVNLFGASYLSGVLQTLKKFT